MGVGAKGWRWKIRMGGGKDDLEQNSTFRAPMNTLVDHGTIGDQC